MRCSEARAVQLDWPFEVQLDGQPSREGQLAYDPIVLATSLTPIFGVYRSFLPIPLAGGGRRRDVTPVHDLELADLLGP